MKRLLEVFRKKNCRKLIKKNLEWRKFLKEKVINCMLNGKDMTIHLIVGSIKKISYKKMSKYVPKPSSHEENIKVKIDLTNYATKADIKNITYVDTSNFALKTNSANLKTEVDKLDIE